MLGRLFLLFTITTAVELVLLIRIGAWMGILPTIALIVFTGFLGAWLTQREGLKTLARVREQTSRGEIPGDALLDGLCILLAGAFLVTPGILTDLVGFSLLIPPLRAPIKAAIAKRAEDAIRSGRATGRVTFVEAGPGGFHGFDIGTPPNRSAERPREHARLITPDAPRPYRSGDVIDVTES